MKVQCPKCRNMVESGRPCSVCGYAIPTELDNVLIDPLKDVGRAATVAFLPRRAGASPAGVGELLDTNKKMLAVQEHIAVMQAELVDLNHKQVQLQSQMLDVQRRQLVIQEQQLVMQKISAIQLQLQTEMMQLKEVRDRRQRALKAAAFGIRNEIEKLRKLPDALVRLVWLKQLDQAAKEANLLPSELEELTDKEYVHSVYELANSELDRATFGLSEGERRDCDWLLEGADQALSAQVAAGGARVAEWKSRIDQLETEIQTTRARAAALGATPGAGNVEVSVISAAVGALLALGLGFIAALAFERAAAGGLLFLSMGVPAVVALGAFVVRDSRKSARIGRQRGAAQASEHAVRLEADLVAAQAALRHVEASLRRLGEDVEQNRGRAAAIMGGHPGLAELGFSAAAS